MIYQRMSERSAVQNPMLCYAEAVGWRFVPREEALRLRGGESGQIFAEVLTAQLLRLNPGVVDAARAGEISPRIRRRLHASSRWSPWCACPDRLAY